MVTCPPITTAPRNQKINNNKKKKKQRPLFQEKKEKKKKKGKKEEEERGYVPSKKKKKGKKERKKGTRYEHFCPLSSLIFSFQLSLHFGENTFVVDLGKKHLDPTIYFPFSSPNQTHSKKIFFLFSLQNFPSTLFHLQTNTSLKSRFD